MSSKQTIIVGIGGMGGNTLNNFISTHGQQGRFLQINTDSEKLRLSLTHNKLLIGETLLRGLGTHGNASLGRAAAEESLQSIGPLLSGAHIVCLVAGLGGGTGSGATEVIAKHALQLGTQVVCVVSTPFQFEGKEREIVASDALTALGRIGVDTRVFKNQELFKTSNANTTFADAFRMADAVLLTWIHEASNA